MSNVDCACRQCRTVNMLLNRMSCRGITLGVEQFDKVFTQLSQCKASDFDRKSMAGLLTIIRYSLRKTSSCSKVCPLSVQIEDVKAMHKITPDVSAGVTKLYEIFIVAVMQSETSGLPIQHEFQNLIERALEFFIRNKKANGHLIDGKEYQAMPEVEK